MPTSAELNACRFANGEVNLTLLFDLCVARLYKIHTHGQGARRHSKSRWRLREHVHAFLAKHNYPTGENKYGLGGWFDEQPAAQFSLELNAENDAT
jgi:hypothetical protein